MFAREYILEKIKSMPDEAVEEIRDFIDFLEARRQEESTQQQMGHEATILMESGMRDYLNELVAYEEMLAKGEIDWR